MKVVGKSNVQYISKRTNSEVKGISLHCVGKKSNVEGEAVETVFISAKSEMFEQCVKLPLGTEVQFYYNRWGNVESVTPCK